MATALITPDIIVKEAMLQMQNHLVMGNNVHRNFEDDFAKNGESVRVRRPNRYDVTDGATLGTGDTEEANFTFTAVTQKHVPIIFTSKDLTTTIEEFSARYIRPAMIALANKIDADGLDEYKNVYSSVSADGSFTVPNSFADLAVASKRLDNMAVPPSNMGAGPIDRVWVGNPGAFWDMASAQTTLFQQGMVKSAFTRGKLGNIAGFAFGMDQNTKVHTNGVLTGTPLVNGASQNVTYLSSKNTWTQTLLTDGWTNSLSPITVAGDVFTIAGVNHVNPVSKQDSGFLQDFVVTADANSGASTGPATLTISPPIITSGPYQTVSAVPADNAAITERGATVTDYVQNMAFHKDAFSLAMRPLEIPDGVSFSARVNHEGFSIRLIKDYDISSDQQKCRLDVLYGWKTIYPELAARYWAVNT